MTIKNLMSSLILIFFLLISSCQKKQATINIDKDEIVSRIVDDSKILTEDQRNSLFLQIEILQKELGPEIAVILLQTLGGENINQYASNAIEKLRLGRDEYKDGLLIVVSINDREARIEVGYGLEKIIKDETASQILREVMGPDLKNQNYYKGISEAINEIKKLIEANKELIGERL